MVDTRQKKYFITGFILLMSAVVTAAHADTVVIGHPGIHINQLTVEQVSDLFLAKTTKLPDGTPVTILDQRDGSPIKDTFYSEVVGKTPNQLKAYWAKIVFTGQGVPPKSYGDDQAILDEVAKTPGAISYIDDSALNDSVKVLMKR